MPVLYIPTLLSIYLWRHQTAAQRLNISSLMVSLSYKEKINI